MKNRKIFLLLLVFIISTLSLSGCFGCVREGIREDKFAKIPREGDYAFSATSMITYNGQSFSLKNLADKVARKEGFLRTIEYLDSYDFGSITIGNEIYFWVIVDDYGYGKHAGEDYIYAKWSIEDPENITVLEYVTDTLSCGWDGRVRGGYLLENRRDLNNCVVLCKIENWTKTYVEKAEDYSVKIVNEALYFYKENKELDVCDYVFFDENLQKYSCAGLPNKKVTYVTQSYVLFDGGNWFDYESGKAVEDSNVIYELDLTYMNYLQEQELKNSKSKFYYNGEIYSWKNEFAPRTEDDRPDFHTASELVVRGANSEYRFKYAEFEKLFPQIYEIYPSLYVLDVINQNDELYFVYGYETGGAFSLMGSNQIILKYDEQTKGLVYIGYNTYMGFGISNVFKAQ